MVYEAVAKFRLIDTIPIGVETILVLTFSFYFLYELMNNDETLFIYEDYRFWIVIGFIVYLAGSFFIYIYTDNLLYKEVLEYWPLTNLFATIKNLLFSAGILIFANQKNDKPKNPSKRKFSDIY